MILPGLVEFEGVVGTTFDGEFVIYPSEDSMLKWESNPLWNSEKEFQVNSGVIARNGKGYKSIKASLNKNPETETEYWTKLTPQNITGYKPEVKIGNSFELILKVSEGVEVIGEEGLVKFKATRLQTEKFSKGPSKIGLFIEDKELDYYEYAAGKIIWKEQ